uniref:Reverse transcriptase domain-containing protein n=1 Tax=Tanacetum cinerariifolium TaxID=118510 RepID=A0A699H4G9_TANCI|nr:reverse transcriptase domain-containing protein [Tanacetum cinerariifolium]
MRTHSSSNLPVESPLNPSTFNPKHRNRRRSKQPFILEESLVDTMADQRTMAELLRAPTEGYAEAIVVPLILAEQFEIKHSLINMMTSDQFFGLEKDNPHYHIRAARRWLKKEPSRSILTWEDLDQYKYLIHACPHHGFAELHQLDTLYNTLNPANQNSLNSAAGGNLLERRTQDVLTIIENKSKVRNSRNKSIVYQVESSDANSSSSSEIAKLTHVVNQQTSVVTTAMTAILKQFQATPPPASVKVDEETCVTCGGSRPSNTIDNPKGELKAITTRSGIVLDGPFVSIPPPFINPKEDERVGETLTDQDLVEYTIKVLPPLVQKPKPPTQRNFVKMLKALLSNKKKLLELANTPLNENCSAVILKKLPEKLGDPGKFLIPCSFSKLKCKALADLGASINLMPLSLWKKLGLPELISTIMTLKLANRAICTPAGIARDVFVPVGKSTFPSDFVIVNYESDPRVPLILGRPFLWTARALIDVHGEEMILHDGDERLTLNMRHDTSSYSNQPQEESINMINIYDDSKGGNVLIKKLLDLDSTKDPHEKFLNINLLIAKIKSLNDNHTFDHVFKPLSPSSIPVEDSDSFLEKSDTFLSYSDNSLPEYETFINHTEETNSGITTTHADYSLPKYNSFLFEIKPDHGKLTSVVMKDNLAEPRIHVPNVLTTHSTLMLDSDFIPSDNSLPEYEIF